MNCLALSLCICSILCRGIFCGGSKEIFTPNDDEYYYPHVPPVKIIQSEDGDVIHCVEINRQPALRNPSSRKSFAEFKPPVLPKRLPKQNTSQILQVWRKSGSCPEGTVPILARTKAGPVNYKNAIPKTFPRWLHNGSAYKLNKSKTLDQGAKHEHSILMLKEPGKKYNGVWGKFNVWNPSLEVGSEMSLAQIWVTQGEYAVIRTVEAGWMVQPTLFGDFLTRLFVFFTRDGYQTACYNEMCDPGFVPITNKVAIGGALTPSIVDGPQVEAVFAILKDATSGSWCFYLEEELVGYWPNNCFPPSSFDYAEYVAWGGEIGNRRTMGQHTSTQMGSGHFPFEGLGKVAYITNIEVYDATYGLMQPPATGTRYGITNPNCYNLRDYGDLGVNRGRTITYGGPGFDSIHCP